MRKVALGVLVAVVFGACLPFTPIPNPNPTADTVATAVAGQTSIAQTLTAQSTPTSVVPPTASPVVPAATDSPTVTLTFTPVADSPTSGFVTPGPLFTDTPLPTFPPPSTTTTLATGQPTWTATLGILKYGTLPPALPSSGITLVNKSKAQAYISLQVTTKKGGPTIIEYPVQRTVRIQAPIGYYLYVAWVGGNKMVGNFSLSSSKDLVITLYKDKVVIR